MSNTINEYRTGLKLGARSEFLAIGEVTPGHEETLRQTLARHMGDPNITNAINEIGTLHEARFLMFDGCNGRKQLMFASSFDGPWDTYIDDFGSTHIGLAFDETWCHVDGYPGMRSPGIKQWFKEHTVVAGNFVAAYPAPTVKQVLRALAVYEAFEQVLDNPDAAAALQHPRAEAALECAAD